MDEKDDFMIIKIDKNIKRNKFKENENIPWTDKYRPIKIKKILLPKYTKKRLISMIEKNNLENIIITGDCGTGKSILAFSIAYEFQGNEKMFKQGVLELKSSNDRGIKTVTDIIDPFCKSFFNNETKEKSNKIVILDEADNMTEKEQQLVAKLMEVNKNTKFIFTCNNTSKIINPIQSRCLIIKLIKQSDNKISKYIQKILKKENYEFEEEAIFNIIKFCNNDIRFSLNLAYTVCSGFGSLTLKKLNKLIRMPTREKIISLINEFINKNFTNCCKIVKEFKNEGYSNNDILVSLLNECKEYNFVNEDIKHKVIDIICNYFIMIKRNVNSELQLFACLAEICKKI